MDGLVAAAVTDELAHHAQPARPGDDARVRRQVAGDDPQQGGLAGTVGADERDLLPVADAEADVVEQHPPVRQLVAHSGDIHVTHARILASRTVPVAWLSAGRARHRGQARSSTTGLRPPLGYWSWLTPHSTEQSTAPRWKIIGPGLVVAATGVGAADLVATLIAGQKFGYTLLWCVVVGCIMKIVLVEGAGRYSLATGRTIFEGWRSLGAWTTWYFAPYIVIWGFVYGAAAMAGTGLALTGLVGGLSTTWWGILSGLLGLVLVWTGRYSVFEKVLAALVGIMFVTMVGAALLTLPNLGELLTGLAPRIPDGGLVNTLALAGGVGGTITLAAYGYWLREKGWDTPRYMRVMRIDNTVAYVVTGIFVLATLVVGAELLYSTSVAIESGDQGLVDLGVVLQDRYGQWAGKVFLLGFWAAAMSSLVGVWNGVSLMFADFMTNVTAARARTPTPAPAASGTASTSSG